MRKWEEPAAMPRDPFASITVRVAMRTIRYPTLLALLLPAPALADTLPLTRGYYVETGTPCRGAPNVALRDYQGDGIGSSKAGQCHARVLARIGQRYTLRQNCVQYGGPRQYRAAERLKIRVDSRTSYTDLRAGAHYRWCRTTNL